MKNRYLFTLPVLFFGFAQTACNDSTQNIEAHYGAMTQIASAQSADCASMASALMQYLDTHRAQLEKDMADVSSGKESEVRRIYAAAQELEQAVVACESHSALQQFKSQLSAMVLQSAGLDK